jgi:ribosomal protein S18 acetylase RimI-like enzyme
MRIEPYAPEHLQAVVRLSLRAWAPVFDSMREALGPEVFLELYPDWPTNQRKAVEDVCAEEGVRVWVAIDADTPVAFVAVKLHAESRMGEIYMLAVDPDAQRRGVGAALTTLALDWMKEAGMAVAMVETGGDPGHAPARRTYEKAGFGLMPIARYFKKL